MAFNATADSSLTGIKLVVETTPGVTPATPTMLEFEITSESLNNSRETTTSQSFRADRQVPGVTTTEINSAGDTGFELKVCPAMDEIWSGLLQNPWVGDEVQNGVARKSFTIEKSLGGIGGENHMWFMGSEISNLSLDIQSGSIIGGSIGWIARDYATGTATRATTVTPAPNNRFLNAVDEGVKCYVNGVEASTGLLQALSLSVENSLRPQRAIGTGGKLAGMGNGRFGVSGSITAYFNGQANPIYTAYKNKQPIELKIELPDPDGNAYNITMYRVELMNATLVAGGLDQDMVFQIEYQAVMGGEDNKTIGIERVTV